MAPARPVPDDAGPGRLSSGARRQLHVGAEPTDAGKRHCRPSLVPAPATAAPRHGRNVTRRRRGQAVAAARPGRHRRGGDGPSGAGAGRAVKRTPRRACAACSPSECCDGVCVDLASIQYCTAVARAARHTCDNASCTNTCAQWVHRLPQKSSTAGCERRRRSQKGGNCGIDCASSSIVEGLCKCSEGTADCDGEKEHGCEADTSRTRLAAAPAAKLVAAALCGRLCDCAVVLPTATRPPRTARSSLTTLILAALAGWIAALIRRASRWVCGCMQGFLDCDRACWVRDAHPDRILRHMTTVCPAQAPACDGIACSAGCGSLTPCGSSCVDTQLDLQNCGLRQGRRPNQTCVAGKRPAWPARRLRRQPDDCEANTTATARLRQLRDRLQRRCAVRRRQLRLCTLDPERLRGCVPAMLHRRPVQRRHLLHRRHLPQRRLRLGRGVRWWIGPCCAGTGCFGCCGDLDCGPGRFVAPISVSI